MYTTQTRAPILTRLQKGEGEGVSVQNPSSVSFKVCLESQPKRVEFLFEMRVAERLERWTCNPEVPSSSSTLTMDWICSQESRVRQNELPPTGTPRRLDLSESSVTLVNSQLMWFASGHLKIFLVVFIESKLFVPVLIFLIRRPRCKLLSYQSFCHPLQVNFYPFICSKIGPILTLLLMVHFNVQSCE